MKRLLFCLMMMVGMLLEALAQSYETQYRRPVNNVMQDIAKRFGVKFRFDSDVDTAGVMLTYADFRIRPYSLEQTLDNICKHLGWNWWKQNGNLYRIKLYEYPRRHVDEGRQMLDYLATKYHNAQEMGSPSGYLKERGTRTVGDRRLPRLLCEGCKAHSLESPQA